VRRRGHEREVEGSVCEGGNHQEESPHNAEEEDAVKEPSDESHCLAKYVDCMGLTYLVISKDTSMVSLALVGNSRRLFKPFISADDSSED